MIHKKTFYSILLILAVGGILMFGFLGMYPLMDPDEPVYAETAREMIMFGDFVSPRIYGEFWYDKPPMYYWLVAGAFQILGISDFAARFPSAVLAIGGAILLYLAGRKLLGERAGLISALILVTSLEYFYLGNAAVTDMTLTFFLTASLLAFLHHRYWLMYACCGLGVLTKGPVALFFCGVIIVLYLLLTRSIKRICSMKMLSGIVIFCLIALPWYIAMYSLHGMEFVETFLGFHNVTRFLQPEHSSGVLWYYYIPVLLVGFFPWTPFLVQSLWTAAKEKGEVRSTCRFLIVWAAVVFLFFSASQTKLVSYILPMYPPLALLGGYYFDKIWTQGRVAALKHSSIWFTVLAMLLIGGLLYGGTVFEEAKTAATVAAVVLFGAAIAVVGQSRDGRFCRVLGVQVSCAMLFFAVLMTAVVPNIVAEFSVAPFVPAVQSAYDGQSKLYIEKFYRPGLMYYGNMAGTEFLKNDLTTILTEEQDKAYFVLKDKWYEKLSEEDKNKLRVLVHEEDKMFLVLEKTESME